MPASRAGRRRTGQNSLERLVHARPPALDRVEARVDDEPVQPRRELRAAAELLQPNADLASASCAASLASSGSRRMWRASRSTLGCVPGEQRLERLRVAVLRARDEHRVAELLVDERGRLPQRLRDRVSHRASLVAGVRSEPRGGSCRCCTGGSGRRIATSSRARRRSGCSRTTTRRARRSRPITRRRAAAGSAAHGKTPRAARSSCPCSCGRPRRCRSGRSSRSSRARRSPPPCARLGVDASLRHPNDVVVAGRKLVGVLPEASQGRVVLGIGVNVNQTAGRAARRHRRSRRRPCASSSAERSSARRFSPRSSAELERGYDAWAAPYRR